MRAPAVADEPAALLQVPVADVDGLVPQLAGPVETYSVRSAG